MIDRALAVFVGTAVEMRATLTEMESLAGWMPTAGVEEQAAFETHLDEIDRLLHNFLAAGFSLSSYTQTLRSKVDDPGFTEKYDQRNPFTDPQAQVVHHLRNDVQHARLPAIRLNVNWVAGPPAAWTITFTISRSSLEGLKVNAATRAYLAALDADLPLQDLVDDHANRVQAFTTWFIAAVIEHRAAEFDQLAQMRSEASLIAEPLEKFFELRLLDRPVSATDVKRTESGTGD